MFPFRRALKKQTRWPMVKRIIKQLCLIIYYNKTYSIHKVVTFSCNNILQNSIEHKTFIHRKYHITCQNCSISSKSSLSCPFGQWLSHIMVYTLTQLPNHIPHKFEFLKVKQCSRFFVNFRQNFSKQLSHKIHLNLSVAISLPQVTEQYRRDIYQNPKHSM